MELLNRTDTVVTETVYTIQDEVSAFYYKEWTLGLDDRGKVIDSSLVDKDGMAMYDPELLERVQKFIDDNFPA